MLLRYGKFLIIVGFLSLVFVFLTTLNTFYADNANAAGTSGGGSINEEGASELVIELGDIGFDMELDPVRQQLYVSVPTRNEVVIISTQSYEIIDRVIVGSRPHGIDLSLDGTLLFTALNGAGAVAYLDIASKKVTEVVVGAELGDSRAYDVVEAKSNRVFVSANPGSSGFAYITMIKRDQGNSVVRVANNRIIRARPIFEESPDHQFLYVGEGFSPNSLYKLDISIDSAPIVLEDQHGSVSGTDHLEVNPDGSRIYLGSGQVLRTGSFIQAGLIGRGVPKLNNDGSLAYVGKEPNIIEIYDTTTFLKVGEFTTSCSFSQIQRLEVLPDESGWLILGDDIVCVVSQQPIPEPITLNITKAKVKFNYKPNDDEFKIKGKFVLGEGNNGIDPIVEDVIVNVGTSSIVIPAPYSFEEEKGGVFKYKGIINSTDVEIEIKTKDYVTYNFKVEGKGTDLTGTANPVDVELIIGDDKGNTNIKLEGVLKSKENEK